MINTVLGAISREKLGKTLIHEHIYCGSPDLCRTLGDRWFDRTELVDVAVKKLTDAREKFGLATVVDGTPSNLGRDIDLLREVSYKSKVNIVASCGMYYSEDGYLRGMNANSLSEFFVDECTRGCDNTYKTENPVFPGILKCATGSLGFTENNKMLITAMSLTQQKTHLPMFAHNEHWLKTADTQIDIFSSCGVDFSRLIIGHSSDCTDADYLEGLLRRGVYLGFDRLNGSNEQIETLCELVSRGWSDKILLSRDGGVFVQFSGRTWAGERRESFNSFTFVIGEVVQMLKFEGVSSSEIDKMLYDNPAKILDLP
ncbi:MAG: hypothetical protein IKV97_00615 [Clostridia bacterium]|nr:hypothetical protein [Clostridia bacterium]